MGQAGAKRKPGAREGNGRLQRPTAQKQNELERERQFGVMSVVMGQPHRQLTVSGVKIDPMDDMLGTPVGQFLIAHMQDTQRRRIYYDAAMAYRTLKTQWAANWGLARSEVPADDRSRGTGAGPPWAVQNGWWKQIREIESKIIYEGGGKRVLDGMVGLIVSEKAPTKLTNLEIVGALWIIATQLGKLDSRLNKMA